MAQWKYTRLDASFIRDLRGFLPEKIFDVHAHLYEGSSLSKKSLKVFSGGPTLVSAAVWKSSVGKLVGADRLTGALFIPMPSDRRFMDASNDFVLSQVQKTPGSRALVLVAPGYPVDKVREYAGREGVAGFKPYHLLSGLKNSYEAPLKAYLPEWAWKIADERGLAITLHMVRSAALSDPGNLKTIRAMCEKYPRARLILAHAARGFHPANTLRGLPALSGLTNIWFDASGICESAGMTGILQAFGPSRLMWGSDFPISHVRGKCVSAGDAFVWLTEPHFNWKKVSPACEPILVGIESLLALREAADSFGLSREDVANVFCGNASRLLGIETPAENRTQALYRHAKERIPGGVQLLSKRPEMFAPDQWPAYYSEARGCETWDLDGRHYYDMSITGIGASLLGFRDPDVTRAVQRRLNLGGWCTLNPPDEVELADVLCEIHPWAERVRFMRTGGECAAVGVRIARATTDRSLIAICGYHGWQDWYLAANLGDNNALRGHLLPGLDPFGVPEELRGSTLPFRYNDRAAFQAILDQHGSRLAAVVMEPCRFQDPEPGFLEFVRDGVHKAGGLLIFDEITIGWRLNCGGAHLRFGVNPDMALFAKSTANGHPMSAVIGTTPAMEGAQKSFISSAFWTEGIGPAAALATIKKMRRIDVPGHVARMGGLVIQAWKESADRHRLPLVIEPGFPSLAHCRFDHELANELKTLYIQGMLERGFLATLMIYPTLAHNEKNIALYARAIDQVFGDLKAALDSGKVREQLKGPPAHSGFRRLL